MDKVASEPSSEQGFAENIPGTLFPPVLQTTVRFSQSDLLLISSDETVASSKDVERIPSLLFLTPSHPLSPVRL